MSINCFLQLREIDSLTKMRISHLRVITDQEDRLKKLNGRLEEDNAQTVKLKQELFTLQHSLHEIEQKLKLYQRQQQNLNDIGENTDKYIVQIDEAEGQGLELLEKIEQSEKELKELREFEAGLKKTIHEISQEVKEIRTKEGQEIQNIDLRISALEQELPSHFRDVLRIVQRKNLAHGPFTRNEGGSCFFCRYKISRMDESGIDLQQSLKQCPQCSRIFLPYGS